MVAYIEKSCSYGLVVDYLVAEFHNKLIFKVVLTLERVTRYMNIAT